MLKRAGKARCADSAAGPAGDTHCADSFDLTRVVRSFGHLKTRTRRKARLRKSFPETHPRLQPRLHPSGRLSLRLLRVLAAIKQIGRENAQDAQGR
ncbi:MAG: hypothetical protein ACKPB0_03885, partial [Opitutaceae bacterium]